MHPICTLRRSGTQTDVEEQEQTMSQALISAGVRTSGGEGGIRTLGTGVSPYNGLANRRIRPLCHLSGAAEFYFITRTQAFRRSVRKLIFVILTRVPVLLLKENPSLRVVRLC